MVINWWAVVVAVVVGEVEVRVGSGRVADGRVWVLAWGIRWGGKDGQGGWKVFYNKKAVGMTVDCAMGERKRGRIREFGTVIRFSQRMHWI